MDYDDIAQKWSEGVKNNPSNAFYERPATKALLSDVAGLDVMDAGCGDGYFVEYMCDRGAHVVGYDPSTKVIELARKRMQGKPCELHVCETAGIGAVLAGRKFDLILSSMVLHYIEDLRGELLHYKAALKPGGSLLVSMKHPLIHVPQLQKYGYWPTYHLKISWEWADGEVVHIQRPLVSITNAFYAAGFYIDRLVEPFPLPEMKQAAPNEYAKAMALPFFIHFVLKPR